MEAQTPCVRDCNDFGQPQPLRTSLASQLGPRSQLHYVSMACCRIWTLGRYLAGER